MQLHISQSFNSTLVQLKAFAVSVSVAPSASFNSTLVQLKAKYCYFVSLTYKKFQFYLSSIKSQSNPLSSLRRLGFNSTLVQLKVKIIRIRLILFPCFNSTLVQLKDIPRSKAFKEATPFQFYLSSIKSVR